MPYISPYAREEIGPLGDRPPANPGELNFLFTSLIGTYLLTHQLNYQTINDILGALEGAKHEFYRRIAAPYEDGKIIENGDVY